MGHPTQKRKKKVTPNFQLATHASIPKLNQYANQELFKEEKP
jgi:hypothetical protein